MHSVLCKTLLKNRFLDNTRKQMVQIPQNELEYAVSEFKLNPLSGIFYLLGIVENPIKVAILLFGHGDFCKEQIGEFLALPPSESPEIIKTVKFAFIRLVQLEKKDICQAFHLFSENFHMPKMLNKKFWIFYDFAEVYQHMNPANRTLEKLKNVMWLFVFAFWYFKDELHYKSGKVDDRQKIWFNFNEFTKKFDADMTCLEDKLMTKYYFIFKNIFDVVLEKNLRFSQRIFKEWERANKEKLKVKSTSSYNYSTK